MKSTTYFLGICREDQQVPAGPAQRAEQEDDGGEPAAAGHGQREPEGGRGELGAAEEAGGGRRQHRHAEQGQNIPHKSGMRIFRIVRMSTE